MEKIKIQFRQISYSISSLLVVIAKSFFSKKSRFRLSEIYQTATYPFFGNRYVPLNAILTNEDLEVVIAPLKAKEHNVSEFELLALCALVKDRNASQIFEIGTFDGRTTRAMCKNTSEAGHVYTLNLPPETETVELKTSNVDVNLSKKVVSGERFINTPEAMRITQLWGDSAKFNFAPYNKKIDFVFIDGAHNEEYVQIDTANSINLIKEDGGMIVWHDSHLFGVKRFFVNSTGSVLPAYFIKNTSLAVMLVKNGRPVDVLHSSL
jgi:predicted O-methyltransferase YrrM